MINYVLRKYIKNLNNVSLSAEERAVLRKDFLAQTGLHAPTKSDPIKSSFVLVSSSAVAQSPAKDDEICYELYLADEFQTKIRTMENDVTVKICLKTSFAPQTFIIMKIVPSKKDV